MSGGVGRLDPYDETDEPISLWFGLSHASYAVVPRVLLEVMPVEWQRQFVKLAQDIADAFPGYDTGYTVLLHGYYPEIDDEPSDDPLSNYRRPNLALLDELRKPQ